MRSALLSAVRHTTSSRQSPNRSALRAGFDLVPLLAATPDPVSRRVSPPVPYLSMWVASSSSRLVSPSHQTVKLVEPGWRPMVAPLASNRPLMPAPEDQNSAPGLPG